MASFVWDTQFWDVASTILRTSLIGTMAFNFIIIISDKKMRVMSATSILTVDDESCANEYNY